MAVTDYKSPGTTATAVRVDAVPDTNWINTDNAKISNDLRATTAINFKSGYCDWLRVTNFSMGVPAGATIDGIEVQIERKDTWAGGECVDSAVYLRKTTVGQVGDNYASETQWPEEADATETYGGAADLWNAAWSAADVNHADFGLDLSVLDAIADEINPGVDHIQIRIHYTEAVVGTNMKINISDVFKDIESLKINIGDAWKNVIKVQQNIGDVWKNVFG